MDFALTDDQREIERLTHEIMSSVLTREHRVGVTENGGHFDPELWRQLGMAGLLALALPERYGGAARGVVDACLVLIGAGRHTAPVPVAGHTAAAITLARHGSAALNDSVLADIASGEVIAAPALTEAAGTVPHRPDTQAVAHGVGYRLRGRKSLIPGGMVADLFLVTAGTPDGTGVFAVQRGDPGVEVTEQTLSGGFGAAQLTLADVPVPVEGRVGGPDSAAADSLADFSLLGACAQQYGVTREAVAMTAGYAKTRKQFDRPIGSFQAVAHRLADGYIDVLGQELTLWKAAFRLDAGLPAQAALASAKFWAAESGHRVAHSTVHVHGGVGVDLTGDAHRYYSMAKHLEFLYGGAHHHAATLGRALRGGELFENATP